MSDFEVMRQRIHRAASVSGVDKDIAEQIAQPRRVIELQFPVRMDDGSQRLFSGWRVQHSSHRALQGMKGGLKVSASCTSDSITALAAGMTLKCTVAGLPLGGAKGGIRANVHELSAYEKEQLIRQYALEIAPDLGQPGHWVDVPAPDMGTTPNDMAIFADTISRIHGGFTPGVVTGKPVEIGGIPGRVEATGFGVAHIADLRMPFATAPRLVIAGFGNVGSFAGLTASMRDAVIVAVHDPFLGGTLVNRDGIDIPTLIDELDRDGRSSDSFERHVARSADTTLHTGTLVDALQNAGNVDIFLPCAAPQSVDQPLAELLFELGMRLVVEGANSPLTDDADTFLAANKVNVIPDTLANAGGVTCSYLEMSKAASMTLPTKTMTLNQVGEILSRAHDRVEAFAQENRLSDWRLAADAIAVEEIAAVHELRGLY